MGLLDWLTESLGTAGSTGAGMNATDAGSSLPQQFPSGTPPTPPVAPISAPPTVPDLATTDISGGMPAGATRASPPIPTPVARPQMPPTPPGAPQSLAPPTPPQTDIGQAAQDNQPPPPSSNMSIIGQALGLNPNSDKEMRGSLAEGLKSVGTNWNKPGLAAAAGSAGAALSGGNTAQDKITDQQAKYLSQAIAASKAGDERAANQALTKLRLAQAQQAMTGKGGKDSVVNSDQQLYLRAVGATNQDGQLKLLKFQYDNAVKEFGSDSPQAKAAMTAHQKAYDETLNGHLSRIGLDPKKAAQLGKMPGLSQDNPVGKEKMSSQKAFDDLPPGSWFTNPKDGRILQKPLTPPSAAAQPGGQPAQQPAPAAGGVPMPPATPSAQTDPAMGAMAQAPASAADDEEED